MPAALQAGLASSRGVMACGPVTLVQVSSLVGLQSMGFFLPSTEFFIFLFEC